MLVLSRKIGESIRIGSDVTITVLGIQGGHASLGIDAPKVVPVHREEVAKTIQRERGNTDVT